MRRTFQHDAKRGMNNDQDSAEQFKLISLNLKFLAVCVDLTLSYDRANCDFVCLLFSLFHLFMCYFAQIGSQLGYEWVTSKVGS